MITIKVHNKIFNEIIKSDKIIILRHVNPDPDAYGSQIGLKEILKEKFPNKEVYAVGENLPKFDFVGTLDNIEESVYNNSLIIVLDTGNRERISSPTTIPENNIIKIDHHPETDNYASISWVDTSYCSTSEMIYDFALENNLGVSDTAARALYLGIIGDTGRFLYDSTSSNTHKVTAKILENNFDKTQIFNSMYTNTIDISRLNGDILANFKVTENGVAYYHLTQDVLNKFGVEQRDGANLVNTLSYIEGVHIWVLFVDYENETRVRIRSSHTPINHIAREFQGGGHALASGATVNNEKEISDLILFLDNELQKANSR